MKNGKEILILAILLTVSVMFNLYQLFRPDTIQEKEVIVTKTDTVINIVKDYDTVYINKTKYKDVYKYDTLYKDSVVYLRDTVHNYQFREPDYSLSIDAMKLDNYKLDIHARDTVTVTNTVEKYVKRKKQWINVGLQAGYGYGFQSRQFEPYAGVGVQINLFSK